VSGVFLRKVAAAAAVLVASQLAPHRLHAQPAVEQPIRLPVQIGGRTYALETLVVRQAGQDRRPVALITHGASFGTAGPVTLGWVRQWTHDLAHRGWLAVGVMRRGYGNSDGTIEDDAGTCAKPNVGHYLEGHADDLEAALRAIARRPDADMSRVLAIGHSSGGAATMALAARPSVHLAAAVNVSGGLARRRLRLPSEPDPECAPYEADLVRNFGRFGATARMPTLWLYSENDSWFGPALARRLHAAFTAGGGRADLVMLPPFGQDGHAMFFASGGRQLLLPELDRFLRTNGLPTWDAAPFGPLLARLSPADRDSVEQYMRMPTEKVLTLGPNGGVYWQWGEWTLEEARAKALAYCRLKVGRVCSVAAENFDLK